MKAWKVIDRASGPGGASLELASRDDEYVIRANGRLLMSSRQHGSEEAMATVVSSAGTQRILIGGLGMGFTTRAVLDRVNAASHVDVAEISPAVVEWNRKLLAPLARDPLSDPRVTVIVDDVERALAGRRAYDAILLDVDNGPEALTATTNEAVYSSAGLRRLKDALKPRGRVAVWSAAPDGRFEKRLIETGFSVERRTVRARGASKGVSHTIFIATAP